MTHKALSRFKYANRMLSAGDEFTPTERDGRALVAVGRAVYLTKALALPPMQPPAKTPGRRKKAS